MHGAQNPLLYLGFPVTVDDEFGKGLHPMGDWVWLMADRIT